LSFEEKKGTSSIKKREFKVNLKIKPYLCDMNAFVSILICLSLCVPENAETDSLQRDKDTLQSKIDTLQSRADTLREVVVTGDTILPVVSAIKESMKAHPVPKTMTLGDILEKYVPGLQDKMTHPFAIKERRRERKHKRDRKILEHFDQVKTFNELLDEAVRRQQIEDEMESRESSAP